MAPKRSTLLDAPPAASSEEDEATGSQEEEDSEEDTSSSSEEQQTHNSENNFRPSQPPTQTSKADTKKSQQVESETDSETESDSDDDGPTSNVKPKTHAPSVKRGNEVESEAKDAKRVKRDSESNGAVEKFENGKKQLFQRLWSEEDEIIVLKGMVAFAEKKGKDPMKDMNLFCDYIKKHLHVNVSLSQVKDKVSRLKKRFDNHLSKGKKGEEKTFSRAHEQQLFDLSNKIWGSAGICKASVDSAVNRKTLGALKEELGVGVQKCAEKAAAEDVAVENHLRMTNCVDYAGMEEFVMKRGLESVDGAKRTEMQGKWRDLRVAELEMFVMRNALLSEQAELMLAAYKSMEE